MNPLARNVAISGGEDAQAYRDYEEYLKSTDGKMQKVYKLL